MKKGIISVVIPALNEADSLPELLARIDSTFKKINQDYELIFIDDGSSDNSTGIVNDFSEKNKIKAKLIRHYRKHGKSLALMHGFDVAEGEAAILMDADLQDIPELIPDFLTKYKEGYDCVVGWRHKRKDPKIKKLVSIIFNSLTAFIYGLNLHDINCGFKILSRNAYKLLDLRGDMHRLIPVIIYSGGLKVTEIPIEHAPRKHGKSRYNLLRYKGLIDILGFTLLSVTQHRPFHLSVETAVLLFFAFLMSILGYIFFLPNIILLLFSCWLLFLVTILPFFGLVVEIISQSYQDRGWRQKSIKELITHE